MIKHLEDLKPKDLLYFIKNWNSNRSKFIITEKVDGNAMSFGLMKEKFYLSSKSKTFLYDQDISDAYFMKDFKRYFRSFRDLPLKDILKKVLNIHSLSYSDSFEIIGEAIPSHDHNIIVYDPEKIKSGTFIIFGFRLDGVNVVNHRLISDLSIELNKHNCPVTFYKVPTISINSIHINKELISRFSKIVETYSKILEKPARTIPDKQLKKNIYAYSNKIGCKIKNEFLKKIPNSFFGTDCEGLVFLLPNGLLTKIVDKEKYTAAKESNWFFISKLINLQNGFKKRIKDNPILIGDIGLANEWEAELINVEKNFHEMHKNYITINRKFEDTKNEIEMQKETISSIKNYIETTSNSKNNKKIFSLVNSAVPIELLQKNLDTGLKLLGFNDVDYRLVGNLNKRFVGDIDVAIDVNEISKKIKSKAYPNKKFWNKLNAYLTDRNVKFRTFEGFSQFHIVVPLINEEDNRLNAFGISGDQKMIPGTIQIDFFVGDVKWLESVASGAPIESKYKAAHRNLLLTSIFSIIKWTSQKDANIFKKLKIARDGFRLVEKDPIKKKIIYKTFSNDPDLIAKVLFTKTNKWNDINSFEKLYGLLNSDDFKFTRFKDAIFKDFQLLLHSNHLELPVELIQQ